ncbi:MAG TPA: hypothetical protein VHB21_03860 [Minicystis sp.]|nr:hypothetical protein [Minicystis sp.]
MGADHASHVLSTRIEAALRGDASGLPVTTGEAAAQVLEDYGDAIRIGAGVPSEVRAWARRAELEPAVAAAAREAQRWDVPTSLAFDEAAFGLKRRDGIESLRVAVLRVCLERGSSPADLPSWGELEGACRRFDEELARRGSRHEAELLLGDRVVLLGSHPWTNVLPEAKDEGRDADLPDLSSIDAPEPSDEVVASYASRGVYRAFVEAFAAKHADFAEDLADVLASMKAEGELDAIVPRKWLAAFRPASKALEFARPREVAAAAGAAGELSEACITHELREIAPGVEASLDVGVATMRLRVYPGEQRLTRIELGGVAVHAPTPEGIWDLTAPVALHADLAIHGEAGELLSARLRFVPRGSP